LTQEISFIPDNILNCCEIISVPRPTKILYNKCVKNKLTPDFKLENISNIKNLYLSGENNHHLMQHYKIICDKIINMLVSDEQVNYLKVRGVLYDVLIYNLNISESIWYILSSLIQQKKIRQESVSRLLMKTYIFFQYYNNNYRPIYHLENYFFYLFRLIHFQG
jgi:hypothetical protein